MRYRLALACSLGFALALLAASAQGAFADSGPAGLASKVIHASAGEAHACVVVEDRSVKCWGRNSSGQLGLGDTLMRGASAGQMGGALKPVNLGTGRTAIVVETGYNFTCAILDTRELKCWGFNGSGQLGLGNSFNRGTLPTQMGDALPVVDLGAGRKVSRVSLASSHACAILDHGGVKCWGSNIQGQLGLGDTRSRGRLPNEMGDALPEVALGTGRKALQIATGDAFSCALLDDSSVKCWGDNSRGQLGLGDRLARGDGPGEMGDALPAVDLGSGARAIQLVASVRHACALLADSRIKCWGANEFGQLGLGDTRDRGVGPNELGDNLPAIDLGLPVLELASDNSRTCAVLLNRAVKCWGYNPPGAAGALGTGDLLNRGDNPDEMGGELPFVDIGPLLAARQVAVGRTFSCVVLTDGAVKCWGSNFNGQLGAGDTRSRGSSSAEMGAALPFVAL